MEHNTCQGDNTFYCCPTRVIKQTMPTCYMEYIVYAKHNLDPVSTSRTTISCDVFSCIFAYVDIVMSICLINSMLLYSFFYMLTTHINILNDREANALL